MKLRNLCLTGLAIFVSAHAQERLEKISVTSSAGDLAFQDSIVPTREFKPRNRSAQGGLIRELSTASALPFTQYGGVGAVGQASGMGRSASEMNVQTMDVPLNPGQGGGFDFSSLPAFLWSSVSLQNHSQQGMTDSRTSAGTLRLQPWTSSSFENGAKDVTRVTSLLSSLDLRQFSAGMKSGQASVLFGASQGRMSGPGGSAMHVLELTPRTQFRISALGAQVDSEPKGSDSYRTPDATQRVWRLLPVAQFFHDSYNKGVWAGTLFGDFQGTHYADRISTETRDRTRQGGAEFTWKMGDWKVNAGFRRVLYQSNLFYWDENQSHLQWSFSPVIQRWALSSQIGMNLVSRFDPSVNASQGARFFISDDWSIFSRASYSKRYPSLTDLFYQSVGALANPNLRPENVGTFSLGTRYEVMGNYSINFEGFLQGRTSAQTSQLIGSNYQVINTGKGYSWGGTLTQEVGLFRWLELRAEATFKQTDFSRYWGGVGSLIHQSENPKYFRPKFQWDHRVQGQNLQKRTLSTHGYYTTDFEISVEPSKGFNLFLRSENLMDRQVQWIRGYNLPGRSVAIGAQWSG